MSTRYTLEIEHLGTEHGDFCIYQTNDCQTEDICSLVWISKRAHPETILRFKWDIEYGFVWSEAGILTSGVVFEAAQVMPADPNNSTQNSCCFTRRSRAFGLYEADDLTTQGRLSITCDESIPMRTASIGIAMSGKPAFACPACPNMKYTFRLHPRYWIAFGKFEEGEVLNLNRMNRKFEVRFHENQFSKTICLTNGNTWLDKSR